MKSNNSTLSNLVINGIDINSLKAKMLYSYYADCVRHLGHCFTIDGLNSRSDSYYNSWWIVNGSNTHDEIDNLVFNLVRTESGRFKYYQLLRESEYMYYDLLYKEGL